jgi:beta-galactosidase
MVHVVPMPYFNMATACSDDFALAKLCDLFGNSIGSVPFAASWTTSAAAGKICINSEIHAMGGSTLNPPAIPSFADFKRHIFIPLAFGIKGFVFWQYRPETLGLESPAWGLTDMRGAMTDWYKYSIDINNAMQKYREVLLDVMPQRAETAILASHKNQVFDFCCTGNIHLSYGSLAGIQALLYDAGINSDILCAEHLTPGQLKKYRLVYYPFPYYVAKNTADMLKEYVADGGTLISEAFFGAYKDDGYHSLTTPGFGMDEVFGVCETRVIQSEHVQLTPGGAQGAKYQQELKTITESAKILAYYQNGVPAAAANNYKKGKAIFIGTLPSLAYHNTKDANTQKFVTSMLGECEIRPCAWCENASVRAHMLTHENKAAVIFYNKADTPAETEFSLDTGLDIAALTDILTGETVALKRENGCLRGKINIEANSCSCYVAGRNDKLF